VGDRLWWPPFPHKIIGGIVFYGLGHLAYVAACVLIRRVEHLSQRPALVGAHPDLARHRADRLGPRRAHLDRGAGAARAGVAL